MTAYNATLIQDVGELIAYIEQPLWGFLAKFNPEEYRSIHHVYEWLMRDHVETIDNLVCIEHYPKAAVYHKIRNRLKQQLNLPLETLLYGYIKAPRIYDDNFFVQVDLKCNTDLYIQYYRNGMQSALRLENDNGSRSPYPA